MADKTLKHHLNQCEMINVIGGKVQYRQYLPNDKESANKTPIIILHGGPGGSHLSLYCALNEIANHRPAIFYDQLGSYFSPAELKTEHMTLNRFTDELLNVVEHLKLEKAIILGHSWGGAIAADFTLKHPEKIEKLILSSPLISTKRWIEDCRILLDDFPKEMKQTILKCEQDGTTDSKEYKQYEEIFSKQHFISSEKKQNFPNTQKFEIYKTMWGPSEFSATGILKDLNLEPKMEHIVCPTLLITGEYDTSTPEYMQELAKLMPNAKVKVIEDSGHATYIDKPEDILDAVTNFTS